MPESQLGEDYDKDEAEQVDEAKDSYETYKKRMLGKAGNSPKDEGEWSKKMKKQATTGMVGKNEGEPVDEAVDKAHAERKLRNKYLGGNPKVTFHRGYAKVAAAGKEYHHKIHKGQVEDDPYIIADESIAEAEYQGRQVKLGKPMAGDVKKYKVYVRAPSGNVKKVNFGDKNMEIKRDNPERRKNFRARHNCSDKKDRTKAGYWSCRMWSKKPVSKIV